MLLQVETFCSGGDNAISVLANCAAAMKVQFPDTYFWVGFYIVDGNDAAWLERAAYIIAPHIARLAKTE